MRSGEARGRRWSQQRVVAGATSAGLTPAPPLRGCVTSACLGLGSLIRPGETVKLLISWAAGRTAQLMGVHSRYWRGLLMVRSWKLGGRESFC